jgi:hypothetical protein
MVLENSTLNATASPQLSSRSSYMDQNTQFFIVGNKICNDKKYNHIVILMGNMEIFWYVDHPTRVHCLSTNSNLLHRFQLCQELNPWCSFWIFMLLILSVYVEIKIDPRTLLSLKVDMPCKNCT